MPIVGFSKIIEFLPAAKRNPSSFPFFSFANFSDIATFLLPRKVNSRLCIYPGCQFFHSNNVFPTTKIIPDVFYLPLDISFSGVVSFIPQRKENSRPFFFFSYPLSSLRIFAFPFVFRNFFDIKRVNVVYKKYSR